MRKTKVTDIVEQVSEVVEDYLSLIELVTSTKELQAASRSRYVCRCPNCKDQRARTMHWVASMRGSQVAGNSQQEKKGEGAMSFSEQMSA